MKYGNHTMNVQSELLLKEGTACAAAMEQFLADYQTYYKTGDKSMIWGSWQRRMDQIQSAYICSGRRLILEWFYDRLSKRKLSCEKITISSDPRRTIEYRKGKRCFVFHADMQGAIEMDKDTQNTCCGLIAELVAGAGEKGEKSKARTLIKNAFRANTCAPLISKSDAFRLGHLLGFDLKEMESFLFRVFQDSAGGNGERREDEANIFNFKKSRDLIEYVCFRWPEEEHDPEKLKAAYDARCGSIPKADWESAECANVTMQISASVRNVSPTWMAEKKDPGKREAEFLSWMEQNARFLDVPSSSATALARLLARKCILLAKAQKLPIALEIADDYPLHDQIIPSTVISLVSEVLECKGQLPEGEVWTDRDWERLADDLWSLLYSLENNRSIYENDTEMDADARAERIARSEKSTSLFSFLVPRRDDENGARGEATKLQPGGNRLKEILLGRVPPCKNDILLLLFTAGSIIRFRNARPSEELPQTIRQFETAAEQLLDGINFPSIGAYYPAHYTEVAILSSIIFSAVCDFYLPPLTWYLRLLTYRDRQKTV